MRDVILYTVIYGSIVFLIGLCSSIASRVKKKERNEGMSDTPLVIPEDERGHDGLTSAERMQQLCRPVPLDWKDERIARLEADKKTLRGALTLVRIVLGEDSDFLIEKISGPMTNGDQSIIDDMLIKIDAALKATEEQG